MNFKNPVKYLGVFAHREDHIVAGWPIVQCSHLPDFEVGIFTTTNDAGAAIGESAEAAMYDYYGTAGMKNGFSNQYNAQLQGNYRVILRKLKAVVENFSPDYIFTHNPFGEYGHYDHKFVFNLVYNEFPTFNILVSDITAYSSHCIYKKDIPRQYQSLLRPERQFAGIEPNIDWYKAHAEIFKRHKLWTLNPDLNPSRYPNKCNLFCLEKDPA